MPKLVMGLVLLLVLSAPALSSGSLSRLEPEPSSQDAAQQSQAEVLLNTSYDLIMKGGLGGEDQIRALNDLVFVAPDVVSPQKVKEWGNKLKDLADDSTIKGLSGSDRMAFRKNAIVAISKIDSDLGMTLLSSLGPAPSDNQSEDIRAFGARSVFLKYFSDHGQGSVATIQKVAEQLSATGTYPFYAISLIIGELTGKGKEVSDEANKLFDSALDHYYCPPKADNQELEFFTLLQSAKQVVSTPALVKAVGQFVDHLTSFTCSRGAKPSGPKSMVYAALIETSDKKIKIADSRRALLFQAFSFITSVDSTWGPKLEAKDPDLAFAKGTINHVWSTYYPRQGSLAEQQAAEKTGLQKALTQGIGRVRESNPDAALEMTASINDRSTKTIQIASILPSLAQKDLPRSKQLYTSALNDLNFLDEGPQKAKATMWMAEAAYTAEDFNNFRYFATKTFADAIKLLDDSYASGDDITPVDRRQGYSELAEFVRFASARGIAWPLDNVQDLSNNALKAHLLIYAAKGLSHP